MHTRFQKFNLQYCCQDTTSTAQPCLDLFKISWKVHICTRQKKRTNLISAYNLPAQHCCMILNVRLHHESSLYVSPLLCTTLHKAVTLQYHLCWVCLSAWHRHELNVRVAWRIRPCHQIAVGIHPHSTQGFLTKIKSKPDEKPHDLEIKGKGNHAVELSTKSHHAKRLGNRAGNDHM